MQSPTSCPPAVGRMSGPVAWQVRYEVRYSHNRHPSHFQSNPQDRSILDSLSSSMARSHSERMQFLNRPQLGWLTQTSGNFTSLEGSVDQRSRRLYFEMVTKAINNYFPPRTAYGGLTEANVADPRSWFGVTRIYQHPAGKPPLDDLNRFTSLFDTTLTWEERIKGLILGSIDRLDRRPLRR